MAIADEWRAFKTDEPGARFAHQYERMQRHGKGPMIGLAFVGSLLVAAGGVMLVIPGPGLLVILFGLALLAGVSRRLAALLDRTEPRLRQRAHAVRARWRRWRARRERRA